ncbi:luciferase family protein [Streptomyces purpurascens]|uniref:luciferase family protein n=1 Tax=Streptomyces purpurascens TaxID=1924 RepID=UPI0027E53FAC|nr:luciferase family protein [Streptomyces purpurascens]
MRSPGAEIAHFHSGRQADLHLTARMIRHLESDLRHSTDHLSALAPKHAGDG